VPAQPRVYTGLPPLAWAPWRNVRERIAQRHIRAGARAVRTLQIIINNVGVKELGVAQCNAISNTTYATNKLTRERDREMET
jgi:hypothetical protein